MVEVRPTRAAGLLTNAAIALVYAVLGHASLLIAEGSGIAAAAWPAAGVAFAAAYVYGPRVLPGIVIGSFANNSIGLQTQDEPWSTIIVIAGSAAFGAGVQAQCGAVLVRRFVGRHVSLAAPRQIVGFLLLSGPLACVVNATLATLAQAAVGYLATGQVARSWLTWWVGDALGVVMIGPVAVMLISPQLEAWRGRRVFVAVPAVTALAVGVAVFVQAAAMEREQLRLQQAVIADQARYALDVEMQRVTEVLYGVRGLHAANTELSLQAFRAFTRDALMRDSALQAISWNAVLEPSTMTAFVEHQQEAEGLRTFAVRERSASGAVVLAQPTKRRVVVALIEPLHQNRKALGFDIASEPVRRAAIQRAIRSGVASATAPVQLVQETGKQLGFLYLLPVYADPSNPTAQARAKRLPVGFATGVYRFGDLLNHAFAAPRWDDISFRLIDITNARTIMAAKGPVPAAHTLSRPIQVGSRTWRLEVTPVGLESPGQLVNATPVVLLRLGVALLLMTFLLLASGMEHQARIASEIDPLTALRNRRSLLTHLERARRQSQINGTEHALLFLDLDGLKRLNDTKGHEAGDAFLVEVAEALRHVVRDRDTVARIGGDEFAVLLYRCSVERALVIAHSIVELVHGRAERTGVTRVGSSIGIVGIAPPDPEDAATLIRKADFACYAAKRGGGNDARVFEESMVMGA